MGGLKKKGPSRRPRKKSGASARILPVKKRTAKRGQMPDLPCEIGYEFGEA